MTATVKLRNLRNGTATISGLTRGDLRLIAAAIDAGAFTGGDNGGPVSEALARMSHHLRDLVTYPGTIGNSDLIAGTSDATQLYEEVNA